MSMIAAYDNAVAAGEISNDAAQRQIIAGMDKLADALNNERQSWFKWRRRQVLYGFYLYGPVGTGKTFLMDLFYQQINDQQKARFHLHHFMQQIDAQLRQNQGQKDPLNRIACSLAQSIRVLCFDEFFVHNVADAMILGELLPLLLSKGVTLVITSNIHPDNLYLHGIQRVRFLPVIALIHSHCEVILLNNQHDYRLGRERSQLKTYFYPLTQDQQLQFAQQFNQLAPHAQSNGKLIIQNREIPFLQRNEECIWFDFKVICSVPRSQLDYLEIAQGFDKVFISNIPALKENDTLFTILLIHLIDILYDFGIQLIIFAAVPLEQLYVAGEMLPTFQRTLSRLQEMQAEDYLKRHPRQERYSLLSVL